MLHIVMNVPNMIGKMNVRQVVEVNQMKFREMYCKHLLKRIERYQEMIGKFTFEINRNVKILNRHLKELSDQEFQEFVKETGYKE